MDRLFGKELSNMLNPSSVNNYGIVSRLPSKSTRQSTLDENMKNVQKRHDARSTSVNHQDKVASEQLGKQQKQAINKQNCKDVQLVSEYFDQCFNFMLHQESKDYNVTNYIGQQPEINQKMRGILIDWIIELHYKYRMFPETLYSTIMIIDKYLSKRVVKKQSLQLLGTAAFYIAAKYEETYQVPDANDLVHFAAKAFTKQQMIRMEADIIQALDFNLIMITSFRFFQALAKITSMEAKNFHLAQYVMELSLLDLKFLQYKPSILASSAIYLINKIRKRTQSWSDLLYAATNYEEKDLKGCARELCHLLEKADDLPNTKSLKRKFSSSQFHEVTRIKLERKKQ